MADETLTDNSTDLSKLKVPDLKKELKLRGLSTSGNKTELIERLQSAFKSNENVGSESVDDLDEDLLNEDDDEHLDTNESVILENDLDEPPTAVKRKIEDTPSNEDKPVPPKKVVLNRNNSISFSSDSEEKLDKQTHKEIATESNDDKSEEKKVIKLSDLSAKERLEMRAKKFGVTALSVDAKRAARAERFGAGNTSSNSITASKVDTSVDVLKQRAARFGGSVSTAMSNLENKEKMEKRKQRFGSDTTEKDTNGVSDSDKAKIRLERFKQPVK